MTFTASALTSLLLSASESAMRRATRSPWDPTSLSLSPRLSTAASTRTASTDMASSAAPRSMGAAAAMLPPCLWSSALASRYRSVFSVSLLANGTLMASVRKLACSRRPAAGDGGGGGAKRLTVQPEAAGQSAASAAATMRELAFCVGGAARARATLPRTYSASRVAELFRSWCASDASDAASTAA
eukprot:1522389-Prymnesium_polylepis.3